MSLKNHALTPGRVIWLVTTFRKGGNGVAVEQFETLVEAIEFAKRTDNWAHVYKATHINSFDAKRVVERRFPQ